MADIFTNVDIKMLFRGKFILILGSSNFRAVYRDIIWLLNFNKIIPEGHLRRKLDFSYLGDRLIKQGELNRGRDYVEMREYKKDGFHIKYNFITKCLTKEVEEMMHDIHEGNCKPPDIVIVNSCLWDITRWGPNGVTLYKDNMRKLFSIMKSSLPSTTLVIFSTTPPVSQSCSAAFLVRQVEFMRHSLRFEVMEANLFARQLVPTYGYNILDLHYHLRMQIHRRIRDGVHWVPTAVRHMTNLFLTHISLSWGVPLPGNFCGALLQSMKLKAKIWGPDGVNLYKENMQKLFRLFMSNLPSKTLVVFSTTLPVSSSCKGAFLVKQVEFMKHSLRFEVMEANLYAKQLVPSFGYNVLDFHYHFRMQIHRRVKDGVHWRPEAVRHMTNLFLTHLSLTWDLKLPGNFTSKALRRMESEAKAMKSCSIMVKMPQFNIFQDTSMPPPIAPVKKVRKLKSPVKYRKDTENIPPNKAALSQPLSEPFRQRINGPALPQPQIELFRKSLAEVKREVGKANNMPKLMFIDPNSVALSNRDAPGKMKRETKHYKNEHCNRPRLQPY
ncbi:PC-esterase domain-containing protein 1B-like isoform X1 [Ischnura elegans]|uniref:PC-esterase domain-containing protein 1B-like isoform X1 n=1 Tax=Ischnura elegans TaxID=197161 RepID=UPI001ED872AA|nr:PC-esterase domain-containing protein 1B-like isoform X1 [Ischnura elegans]